MFLGHSQKLTGIILNLVLEMPAFAGRFKMRPASAS